MNLDRAGDWTRCLVGDWSKGFLGNSSRGLMGDWTWSLVGVWTRGLVLERQMLPSTSPLLTIGISDFDIDCAFWWLQECSTEVRMCYKWSLKAASMFLKKQLNDLSCTPVGKKERNSGVSDEGLISETLVFISFSLRCTTLKFFINNYYLCTPCDYLSSQIPQTRILLFFIGLVKCYLSRFLEG